MTDRKTTEPTWKLVPTDLPDEMIEAGLACYSEGGCMGLAEYERREVVCSILYAALAAAPVAPGAEVEPVAFLSAFYGPKGPMVSAHVFRPDDFPVVDDRTTQYPLYTHPLDAATVRAEARREALEEAAKVAETEWVENVPPRISVHDLAFAMATVIATRKSIAERIRALADKGEAE